MEKLVMREVHMTKHMGSFQLRWRIRHTCLSMHIAKSLINWIIKKIYMYTVQGKEKGEEITGS